MKLASLCNITKENFLSKNYVKDMAWKLVLAFFNFQRILCKLEPEEVCVLIWTNFDSFANTYLI